MSRSLLSTLLMAVAAVGMTVPLAAQTRSAVSIADLDAAVAERPSVVREAVRDFLTTDRAQEFADRMGTSVTELSAQVAELDTQALNAFAEQAGLSDEVLAGGDTLVITATTAIIILLIILILVK